MSKRLEELSAQCRKYHLKQLLKKLGLLLLLSSLPFSAYYIYLYSNSKTPKSTLTLTPRPIIQAKPYIKKAPSTIKKNEKITVIKVQVPVPKNVIVTKHAVKAKVNYFVEPKEEQSVEDWIEKYNQKKSYYPAMHISKHYYREKNYKQAGIWAKRANQLDRDKEEAWLYYAKSVYALDNIEKARRILTIYLQYKESAKAEILLSEWGKQ